LWLTLWHGDRQVAATAHAVSLESGTTTDSFAAIAVFAETLPASGSSNPPLTDCVHPSNPTKGQSMSTQKNEGEGNHTAAKQYNDAQKSFAESGKVEPAAQDAARAVDGPEGAELRKAEEAGKRHAHGEDPQLKK
jgi:hypothetical protein